MLRRTWGWPPLPPPGLLRRAVLAAARKLLYKLLDLELLADLDPLGGREALGAMRGINTEPTDLRVM